VNGVGPKWRGSLWSSDGAWPLRHRRSGPRRRGVRSWLTPCCNEPLRMMETPRRAKESFHRLLLLVYLLPAPCPTSPRSLPFGLRLWFCSSRVQKDFPHQDPFGLIRSTKDHHQRIARGSWPPDMSPLDLVALGRSGSAIEFGLRPSILDSRLAQLSRHSTGRDLHRMSALVYQPNGLVLPHRHSSCSCLLSSCLLSFVRSFSFTFAYR